MLIKSNFKSWGETQNGCKVSDYLTIGKEKH